MLNLAYVGRRLTPTAPTEVTRDAVASFAAALGDPEPVHPGSVPATFLISLTLPAADVLIDDPDFGLDFSRVLHREQRFAFARPVRVGDRLQAQVIVDSIKTVAGNDLLTLVTDVSTVDGEAVATVTTVLFVAGEAKA